MSVAAAPAAADTMQVQPDGKIVLGAISSPQLGALGRLEGDGQPDRSFGRDGFVIDPRIPAVEAIGLQSDGRIVAAAPGGLLVRYLPDGSPDPSFGAGGLAGTDEPEQPHSSPPYYDGPSSVVPWADGSIFVASNLEGAEPYAGGPLVRRYGSDGELLGQAGPIGGGAGYPGRLWDLEQAPGGALIGAGTRGLAGVLVRLVPGSGTEYDPSFGEGAGLVVSDFPAGSPHGTSFHSVAPAEGAIFAAGDAEAPSRAYGTFLLAKYDGDGRLDTGFGEGGYVAPEVVGNGESVMNQGSAAENGSWARGLAVAADGGITVGGGTGLWSDWYFSKDFGAQCNQCPQPLLARFDSNGKLDPSFGDRGVLRLLEPTGGILVGEIDQIQAVGDKTLVLGHRGRGDASGEFPFIARLNRDGSYDPSFGEGGLEFVEFPCTSPTSNRVLQKRGCTPSALLKLRVKGLSSRHPWLSVAMKPDVTWAQISSATITLPPRLRLATTYLRPKMRLVADGKRGSRRSVRISWTEPGKPEKISLWGIGPATEVRFTLRRGSLDVTGHRPLPRKVRLKVGIEYTHSGWGGWGGFQKIIRRAG